MLKEDFKDEIPQGGRRLYQITDDSTGGIIYNKVRIDRANGNTQDGDKYGAAEVNEERSAINQLTNPNLLINGCFQIWQRGTSFTISGDEAFHYHADRWCVYASKGQTIQISKVSGGIQVSGSSGIIQRLEEPLESGRKYALSAMIDGDVKSLIITGGSYTENSYFKYSKSGSWEQILVKINGITTYKYVKLEHGNIVTPKYQNPVAEEFLMCQRYYFSGDIPAPIMYEYGNNPFQYMVRINYSEMRAKPTVKSNMCVYHDSSGNSVEKSATVLEVARTAIKLRTPDGVRKNNYCFGIGVRIVLDAEIY